MKFFNISDNNPKYKLMCLMPSYNKAKTLSKSIESVLMQKTNFDYKLVILDDCSTDGSYDIALQYQNKYPDKIEVIRNPENLGLLKTISKGYELLKDAKYFCVLDPDDWYTDDTKFSTSVAFLDKHHSYSMYMTNIILKRDNKEDLWYAGKKQKTTFNFNDRKKDKIIFVQTSGIVYRNIYFKHKINEKWKNILSFEYPQTFRADGFRFEWYLQGGKAYFENKPTAVYNYNNNGIWAGSSAFEQHLLNAQLMFTCAKFFPNQSKFYMRKAQRFFASMMEYIESLDQTLFLEKRQTIQSLFKNIYNTPKKKKH